MERTEADPLRAYILRTRSEIKSRLTHSLTFLGTNLLTLPLPEVHSLGTQTRPAHNTQALLIFLTNVDLEQTGYLACLKINVDVHISRSCC